MVFGMEWTAHGRRSVYESPWVSVELVDVEQPGGSRFEHHVVRTRPASGTVVVDHERGVLLLWRHRFITDTWGYEIPAGGIDDGESPADAASREVLEETGWSVDNVEPLISFHPSNGLSDQVFHIFVGTGPRHHGDPSDPFESERIEWVPSTRLTELMGEGLMPDGLSLTACSYAVATGVVAG